jgi:hypothetical protein
MPKHPSGTSPGKLGNRHQVGDAEFLTREFDMNSQEASDLIARNGLSPEDLKARISAPDGEPIRPDPLGGVPTPSEPRKELTKDADEHARKPVVHRRRS